MPALQKNINKQTPMGANLVDEGATFRVWAPGADAVYVSGDFNNWIRSDSSLLLKDQETGYWTGFIPGVHEGSQYKFWVSGKGGEGFKRDPYAPELTDPDSFPGTAAFPFCNCVVRYPGSYPWHDEGYRPPAFNDLIIYQLHIGTFYGVDSAGRDTRTQRQAKFLDVLFRIEYLAALGVNAIQPLPIVEFPTEFSLGYNGVDLFSPEMEYAVSPADLPRYLDKLNDLLTRRGFPALDESQLRSHINQLKALIDICHLYGLAVIFDVVYNHAGGGFDEESLYFFDQETGRNNNNNSLYFTDKGWAGGLSFALWKKEVKQFLIDNAKFFVNEYHIDGIRYDEVSAIVSLNANDGWQFCRDLTATIRFYRPSDIEICEYWPINPYIVENNSGGAGFDSAWNDGLRNAIRSAIGQAAGGRDAAINLDSVGANLYPPFPVEWKAVQCIENHDIVYKGHSGSARIAYLSASLDSSWYRRSRARVANGLLITAPGIPMLFMGQEFLEYNLWSDDGRDNPDTLIRWDGLQGDKAAIDHLRFTQELIWLRRRHPALRGGRINVYHVHNGNRVIAFHRWIEGSGRDVVIVASLNEATFYGYELGFPEAGNWLEVFNSDIYDNWVNPKGVGNNGGITAGGPPVHGLPFSANIVIPANSLIIFAKDSGD